jgi:hypothetical protein
MMKLDGAAGQRSTAARRIWCYIHSPLVSVAQKPTFRMAKSAPLNVNFQLMAQASNSKPAMHALQN